MTFVAAKSPRQAYLALERTDDRTNAMFYCISVCTQHSESIYRVQIIFSGADPMANAQREPFFHFGFIIGSKFVTNKTNTSNKPTQYV